MMARLSGVYDVSFFRPRARRRVAKLISDHATGIRRLVIGCVNTTTTILLRHAPIESSRAQTCVDMRK